MKKISDELIDFVETKSEELNKYENFVLIFKIQSGVIVSVQRIANIYHYEGKKRNT